MRYYSAKADVLVTRYGTGSYIGAKVTVPTEGPLKGQTVLTHTGEVVALTDAEFSKYMREYLQLEREGSLIQRTEKDYKAWVEAEAKATEKETADREAAEKKAAAEQEAAEKKAKAEAKKPKAGES